MTELDHLLWAAPDLDRGTAILRALTGTEPARGGSHPGFGTRNSLLSLGPSYLEVIAPDPDQALEGNRGGEIARREGPGLLTFAVRTTDLKCYAEAAARAGLAAEPPVAMSRLRPDGVRLSWTCLSIKPAAYGGLIPFAIDWEGSPHPAASAPAGCRLLDFAVLHPEPDPLTAIFATLAIPVPVRRAVRPGLLAVLGAARGQVVLLST